MENKKLLQGIEDLGINNLMGPRHIDFYIENNKEEIAERTESIAQTTELLNIFIENKNKNISDIKKVKIFENAIDKAKQEIKDDEAGLLVCREKISAFNKCKIAYAEDSKKGLYYDQDTGELINEEPLAIAPDNAYEPKF